MVKPKSIKRSRKVWATIATFLALIAPGLQATTDIDVTAALGAFDKVIQIGLNFASGVLVLLSILFPDKDGTEPEFIANRAKRL